MKDFIRPELRHAFWHARELIGGLAVAAFALWWMLSSHGIMFWTSIPAMVLGVVLVALGLQRMRFRTDGNGPGVVEVDEARIAYYGPLDGGAVSVRALAEVALDPRGRPDHWTLRESDGTTLHIPVTATGVEALLDAFAQLPGFRTERLLLARQVNQGAVYVVWQRPGVDPPKGDWLKPVTSSKPDAD